MKTRSDNITSGPISKGIVSLAFPVALGMLLEFALNSTDFFWVGKLGPVAQDAVTSSMVMIWTVFVAISIVSVGVTAIVARYVGAKDFDRVRHFVRQGMSMAVLVGVAVSVICYLSAEVLLEFMETPKDSLEAALPYIRLFFASSLLFFVSGTAYAIFRASGDTRTPTKIGAVVVVLNLLLDPLLIFGYGPVPAMGLFGASLATSISALVGTILIIRLLVNGKVGYQIPGLLTARPILADMIKIARIGLPMFTQQLVFVSVYWFLIKIVHQYGQEAAAAMGIGNRMESFSYLICHGFSLAASTMVGQNLGARKPDRAARSAWGAAGIGVGVTMVISLIFVTIPELIAGIFTDDPKVLVIAADYLIILGISQSAMAVEIIIEGAFSGAGDTIPPMMVMLPGSLLRIPLAYYLCFTLGWGINGVWWTLTITSIAKAIILALWFGQGRWKLKEV
ncbi:MAG: MATE family efflux transporter [bacterium]|nr:MATE family efflux transporter [bacterium]